MTQTQITNAYEAINELSKIVFPYKVARQIASLKRRLSEEFDTVCAIEKSFVEKYDGTVRADGKYIFKDTETASACAAEINEARKQDDPDIKLPKVDLSKYTDLLRLSPSAVEALEGIVIFERGEDTDG